MNVFTSNKLLENYLTTIIERKIESILSQSTFYETEYEVEELRKKDYNAQVNVDSILPKYMHLRDCVKWMSESHDYIEGYSEAVSDYIKLKLEFAETESLYLTALREHADALKKYSDKYTDYQKMKVLHNKLNAIRDAEYELIEVTPTIKTITDYDDILEKRRQAIRNMWNDIGETRDYEVLDIRSLYEVSVQNIADRYGKSFADVIECERKERADFDSYDGVVM